MKIKVGKKWYDSKTQPLLVQLSKQDQESIMSLNKTATNEGKYVVFPDTCTKTKEEKLEWMRDPLPTIKTPTLTKNQKYKLHLMYENILAITHFLNNKNKIVFAIRGKTKGDLYLTLSMRALVKRGFCILSENGYCLLSNYGRYWGKHYFDKYTKRIAKMSMNL